MKSTRRHFLTAAGAALAAAFLPRRAFGGAVTSAPDPVAVTILNCLPDYALPSDRNYTAGWWLAERAGVAEADFWAWVDRRGIRRHFMHRRDFVKMDEVWRHLPRLSPTELLAREARLEQLCRSIPTEGIYCADFWAHRLGITEAEFVAFVERRGVPYLRPGLTMYVTAGELRKFLPIA